MAKVDSSSDDVLVAKRGSGKVAKLISDNVQAQSRDSRTCRVEIKNFSRSPLTKPVPYPHCCRTVGNAPPIEIKAKEVGSVNFSKPRLRPMGCSGLLSYMFGRNTRIVIMFKNPMIQFSQNSKSAAAIAVLPSSKSVDGDLYKDMSYIWDPTTRKCPVGKFVKKRAAEGQGELMLDDITIKFVMTQDTNAVLSVELHHGGSKSSLSGRHSRV